MGREREPLEPERQSKTLTAYYWDNVNEFQVNTRYGGEGYLFIKEIRIIQTKAMERMILCILFFLAVAIVEYYWMKRNGVRRKLLVCGLATALAAGLPLMCPYFYQGYDLTFHLLRIEGLTQGLQTGQYPVRIQPQWMNGYGYPVSIFYGDGILFFAAILRLIGFPLQLAYKIYVFALNGLTFGTTFYCVKKIFKRRDVAVAGGVFYTLAPYRLINIYLRGAVGEFTALTFFPLIFLGVYEILFKEKNEKKHSWLILTCGLTGIIQSHILSCEMVGLFLIAVCAFYWKKFFRWETIVEFIKSGIAIVGVNLFFIVPFLSYMREDFYINSEAFGGRIQTTGAFLNQILDVIPHGYNTGKSVVEGLEGGAEQPYLIGLVFLAGIALFMRFILEKSEEVRKSSWVNSAYLVE